MSDDPFDRAVARVEAAAEQSASEQRRRSRNRWSSGQRKAFRIHATVFLAVEVMIFVIWLLSWQSGGTGYPWFLYALLGWGVGLAAHYAAARDHLRRRDSDARDPAPPSRPAH